MSVRTRARKRKYVRIHLDRQSSPCVIDNVKNTYQKGDLFCVMCDDGAVYKFPIVNIFLINETS